MNEIEVGEYVRTIYGEIFKVTHLSKQKIKYVVVDKEVDRNEDRAENDNVLNITEIAKHSKNILDIVEVGDYINTNKVYEITKNYISVGNITIGRRNIKNIRTILTHEQYEQNCYKVGG